MKTAPSEDDAERCFSEKFSKRVSTLPPVFTWKGSGEYEAADRRQCRHDSWGGDRWLLILVRSSLKKISEIGFQKARFWTLDDDSRAEKFSGGGATLSRFLHRRVAGNMRPLTGGDAGMIRWGDRWLLILVRRYFKKFPAVVSKKLEFGHLRVKGENDDDDPRAEKIFWRWCHFTRFFPCRGEGCLAKCAA